MMENNNGWTNKNIKFDEYWKEEEFSEEFNYLKEHGEIFECYLNNNEITGLVGLVYGEKNHIQLLLQILIE